MCLTFAPSLRAELRCGANRATVIRELGNEDGRTAMGSIEILTYRDGTTVTLDKGVVVELVRKGQIIGLKHAYFPPARPNAPADAPSGPNSVELRVQPTPPPLQSVAAKPDISKPQLSPSPGPTTTLEDDGNKRAMARSSTPHIASPPVHLLPRPVPVLTPANHASTGIIKVVFLLLPFVIVVVALGLYVFMSHCLKRICLKAGEDPGILIWFPIAQMIPLLRVAQLPTLLIPLILVPILNYFFILFLWAKVCSALGKSPWLALVLLVPVLNVLLIPYLAFGSGGNEKPSLEPAPVPPQLQPKAPPPLPKEASVPSPSTSTPAHANRLVRTFGTMFGTLAGPIYFVAFPPNNAGGRFDFHHLLISGLIAGAASVVGAGVGFALQKVLEKPAAGGGLQRLRENATGVGILAKH